MLESKSLTHKGRVRETNEDSVLEDLAHGLWIVADGVGGNGNGDVASQMAVQSIERQLRQGAPLVEAIQHANNTLVDAMDGNPELAGMATTVVACRFEAGHYELAWVGDSRAYLINAEGMMPLSSDHNRANDLYQQGEISSDQKDTHQGRHELTQALGQLTLNKIPKNLGELHDGDCLLLCTDGLSGVLAEQEICQIVQSDRTLEELSSTLLDRVLEAGAPDNVTFSLVRYRTQEPSISKTDFSSPSHRLPFDRKPYEENCKRRPTFLFLILLSIIFILFVL